MFLRSLSLFWNPSIFSGGVVLAIDSMQCEGKFKEIQDSSFYKKLSSLIAAKPFESIFRHPFEQRSMIRIVVADDVLSIDKKKLSKFPGAMYGRGKFYDWQQFIKLSASYLVPDAEALAILDADSLFSSFPTLHSLLTPDRRLRLIADLRRRKSPSFRKLWWLGASDLLFGNVSRETARGEADEGNRTTYGKSGGAIGDFMISFPIMVWRSTFLGFQNQMVRWAKWRGEFPAAKKLLNSSDDASGDEENRIDSECAWCSPEHDTEAIWRGRWKQMWNEKNSRKFLDSLETANGPFPEPVPFDESRDSPPPPLLFLSAFARFLRYFGISYSEFTLIGSYAVSIDTDKYMVHAEWSNEEESAKTIERKMNEEHFALRSAASIADSPTLSKGITLVPAVRLAKHYSGRVSSNLPAGCCLSYDLGNRTLYGNSAIAHCCLPETQLHSALLSWRYNGPWRDLSIGHRVLAEHYSLVRQHWRTRYLARFPSLASAVIAQCRLAIVSPGVWASLAPMAIHYAIEDSAVSRARNSVLNEYEKELNFRTFGDDE